MKKLLSLLIFVLCAAAAFAQNVKPYVVDLNKIPAVTGDKTATYDKASRTFTVKADKGQRGMSVWLGENGLDISNYNIVRVKYRVIGDFGFNMALSYADPSISWEEKINYCPSYLTEMVIPLIPGQEKINDIWFEGTWNIDYQQFVLDAITFEKVANPVKTDVNVTDEPPVIDAAVSGKFDDKISSWDYVKKLGVGFNYDVFVDHPHETYFGMDYYVPGHNKRPTREIIQFIKNTGFNTLRLQTSPDIHMMDENYIIDPRYMKELKNIVDWAIEEDMYVIICGPFAEFMKEDYYRKNVKENVHYVGYTVTPEYDKECRAIIKAIWTQYAKAFNNSYDEHLIFETLNEPVDAFHEHNFAERTDCPVCKKDFAIMNEHNQIILDAIRSTGGNNSKRFVMIAGLSSGYKNITTNLFKLPKDKVKDKLIPLFHLYPMGFTDKPGMYFHKYYTDNIKKQITEAFAALDKVYFKKHIPVYVTETGAALNIPVLEKINMIKDFMAEVTKANRSSAVTIHPSDDYFNNRCDLDMWNIKWNAEPEFLNTIFYAAQGKEYPLSEDFIKKNEVIIPSIVGKNLLKESVEIKTRETSYCIDSDVLVRSVPSKYKLEFTIETTGSDAILYPGFVDSEDNWRELVKEKNINIKGASIKDGWCIKVADGTFTINIDEKLASTLEASHSLILSGENIIIKSVKIVEQPEIEES